MLIQWREEYSVGVPEVDREHEELIQLINMLYEAAQTAGSAAAVSEFLGEIDARISAHFALEEKLMRAWSYDRLAEHKADHERLLDELRDIMDDHAAGGGLDAAQLGRRLDAWFTVHFKTHDARLHKFLLGREAGTPP